MQGPRVERIEGSDCAGSIETGSSEVLEATTEAILSLVR
jgi:hypothetical protein